MKGFLKATIFGLALCQILPSPSSSFPSPQLEATDQSDFKETPTIPNPPITSRTDSPIQIESKAAATQPPNIFDAIREGFNAISGNFTSQVGDPVKFFENLMGGGKNGEQGKPQLVLKGSTALVIPVEDGMKNLMSFIKLIKN